MRGLAALFATVALAGCGGGEDPEIRPGPVTIGVVSAGGDDDVLVLRGVQAAAGAINAFGGIGGAAPIELVVGRAEQLIERRVGLVVLPCDAADAREAAEVVQRRDGMAVAPCDDGAIPLLSRVFPTGLSPRGQSDVLAEQVDEPVSIVPPLTRRGRLVARLLAERVRVADGSPLVGTDAPVAPLPPLDAPEGATYVTYGFPEPGSELDEFYERFKAMFGRRPHSVVAALAADALEVLATAIEEAASVTPAAVARQIREEGIEAGGVLGTIEFRGGSSRPETEWVALRVESGRFRVLDRP